MDYAALFQGGQDRDVYRLEHDDVVVEIHCELGKAPRVLIESAHFQRLIASSKNAPIRYQVTDGSARRVRARVQPDGRTAEVPDGDAIVKEMWNSDPASVLEVELGGFGTGVELAYQLDKWKALVRYRRADCGL